MNVLVFSNNQSITSKFSLYLNDFCGGNLTVIDSIKDYDLISNDFNLAFIDLDLDFIDPFVASFELNQFSSFSKPIVFITEFNSRYADLLETYEIDYILNPIDPTRLKQTIKYYVRNHSLEIPRKYHGELFLKLFGQVEVKTGYQNFYLERKIYKELIAFMVLNNNDVDATYFAQSVLPYKNLEDALLELQILIYLLQSFLYPIQHYLKIEYTGHSYQLSINNVEIDYFMFMKVDPNQYSAHRLEMSLSLFRNGLMQNLRNEWTDKYVKKANFHYKMIENQIHCLSNARDGIETSFSNVSFQ